MWPAAGQRTGLRGDRRGGADPHAVAVLQALVVEYLANKRTSGGLYRRNCEIVRRIKLEGLWEGEGDQTFDAWAWRTLRLDSKAVSRALGIAAGADRGRTARGPGRRPTGSMGIEVEKQSNASQPPLRWSSHYVGGPPLRAEAPGGAGVAPDLVGWVERALGGFERAGPAGLIARLPDETDWPRLLRGLAQLEGALRDSRELARIRARTAAQGRRGGDAGA